MHKAENRSNVLGVWRFRQLISTVRWSTCIMVRKEMNARRCYSQCLQVPAKYPATNLTHILSCQCGSAGYITRPAYSLGVVHGHVRNPQDVWVVHGAGFFVYVSIQHHAVKHIRRCVGLSLTYGRIFLQEWSCRRVPPRVTCAVRCDPCVL